MNFAKALARAKTGARIRRKVWCVSVVHTERGLHFLLPANLATSLGTEYEPTTRDRCAGDWIEQ